ncbi:MAG: carbohydrate ABC transporter permease, partial [Exiguobacterium chiriqhucha]
MSVKKKDRITDFFIFIFLSIGAVVMIAPLLWMVSTSLKSKEDVFALPPVWIPTDISFSKYTEIWSMGPLLSGISNSLIVALSVTIVGTFTSSLAAFAFAKLNFRGKNKIFLFLFASVMIPYPVLMIPQFMMFSSIGWVDTLLPLIVPGLFGNIFMIFFLRQFLNSIP